VVYLLWDASALAKRYMAEVGSQTVNAVFVAIPPAQMVTTIMSYSETVAALVRKLNRGMLAVTAFTAAQVGLRNEVINNPISWFSVWNSTTSSMASNRSNAII
jgi:predicted nucleic acid-binding protein